MLAVKQIPVLSDVRYLFLTLLLAVFTVSGCKLIASGKEDVKETKEAAALREAKSRGSKALRKVISDFPKTATAEEAQRLLPAVAWRESKSTGTATAYRAFINEFPNSPEASAARIEMRLLYENALSAFEQRVPKNQPKLLSFGRSLFAYLAQTGNPSVKVHLREHPAVPENSPVITYTPTPDTAGEIFGVFKNVFCGLQCNALELEDGGGLKMSDNPKDYTEPAIILDYKETSNSNLYHSRGQDPMLGSDINLKVQMRIPGDQTTFDISVLGRTPSHFKAASDYAYLAPTELAVEQLIIKLKQTLGQKP